MNEITDIAETAGPSWATPAYDVKGNMTTLPQPDDPTGTYSATYDAWNRLVKLQDGATTVLRRCRRMNTMDLACSPFSDPDVMRVNRPILVRGDFDDEATTT
ncbi:hypothetical protein KOR42_50010 [Thalassoglobus neptunius]|uniref:RHS Repeat protein n=1 Tax=Thalassoglobus neptunius TaxID=1938619 RepID=A0A5C5VN27_9PLAN|nr:hypothetical protein [Thalassoglobus neptunius]TWT40066.1 hypothetical protein KOR42_50010 [Thalassoglobus neptunius]